MEWPKEDLIELFEEFLNENGQWTRFEQWLLSVHNLEPVDLGFSEED